MRGLGVWGIGTTLAVALGAAAADKETRPAPGRFGSKSVFEVVVGADEKKPAPKAAKNADKAKPRDAAKGKDKDKGEKDDAPPPRSPAAERREREEATLLRRLEVCDRLRKVARDTADPDLERLAQQLDTRAWDVYKDRTARLPGAAALEPDEDRLSKKLTADLDAAERLTEERPAKNRKQSASTASVREVNP